MEIGSKKDANVYVSVDIQLLESTTDLPMPGERSVVSQGASARRNLESSTHWVNSPEIHQIDQKCRPYGLQDHGKNT